jgi:hypothetical protein
MDRGPAGKARRKNIAQHLSSAATLVLYDSESEPDAGGTLERA